MNSIKVKAGFRSLSSQDRYLERVCSCTMDTSILAQGQFDGAARTPEENICTK